MAAEDAPVHEDLPNLDALAAGAQGILHGLPGADDRDAAELLGKVNADVGVPCLSHHALLVEGQVPQPMLHHLQCQGGFECAVPGSRKLGLGRHVNITHWTYLHR